METVRILPHTLILFFATAVLIWLAWRAFHLSGPGSHTLGWMMVNIALWTMAAGVESALVDPAQKVLWSQVEYIGSVNASPLLLVFLIQYRREEHWITRWKLALIWLIPLLTLFFVWTNAYFHLIWTRFSPGSSQANVLIYYHGAWYYVELVYVFILICVSFALLIDLARSTPPSFRPQNYILIGALLFPTLTGMMYVFNWNPIPGLDWTPIGFALTAVFIDWGISRLYFLNLVPVAREMIIGSALDGIIVLDNQARVLEINPAAREMLGFSQFTLGSFWSEIPAFSKIVVPDGVGDLTGEVLKYPHQPQVIQISEGLSTRTVEVTWSSLTGSTGQVGGHLLVIRDITAIRLRMEDMRVHRQQLQMVVDGAPWMIAYIDTQDRYLLTNQAYARWCGRDTPSMIGQSVAEVTPKDLARMILTFSLSAVQSQPITNQKMVLGPVGARHILRTSYYPFFADDGSLHSRCIYLQDITGQVEHEETLEAHQRELQLEVDQRTLELEQTIQELKKEIHDRQRVELDLRKMEETLAERLADQSRKLAGLYEVIIAGGQSENANEVLNHTLQRILEVAEAQAGCIHQWREGTLRLVQGLGLDPGVLARIGVLPGNWIADSEVLIPIGNLTEDDRLPEELRGSGFGGFLASPIRLRGTEVGALSVFWKQPRSFSVEEISLVSAIAEVTGVILENLNLRQRVEEAVTLRERRRLARELHDSVTQSLHSLVLSAYAANNRLKQGNFERLEASLGLLTEGARQALKEMRLLLYEMRLVPLREVDMVEALRTRLEMVEQRAGMDAHLVVDPGTSWPAAWEGDLFCIAAEGLNNALKYAQASQVFVNISGTPVDFTLKVTDNGQGFDTSQMNRGGMGLKSMAERAERLGGTLSVQSSPGMGTKIVFDYHISSTGAGS